MKALLKAIIAAQKAEARYQSMRGKPNGGYAEEPAREANWRVQSEALKLPSVDALLAWIEAVEATEQAAWRASKEGHFDDVPRAIVGEEAREAEALARLRAAVVAVRK